MLDPFSDFPAYRACLTRVGGVDVNHAQASGFGLVGDEALQLPESPAMQSSPDSLSGLDVGADVGQVFHADFACAGAQSFRNDGFAGFVVNRFDMPLFTPGDSLEFAFSCAATVGLETTAMGKVDVAVVPQFSASPDLAGAGYSEVILTHVKPKNATIRNGSGIRKIEDEIEVPDAIADDELGFFGNAGRKQVALVLAADERNLDAPGQGKQRKHATLDRVGALVEVDRCRAESNRRNKLVLGDAFVGLERLVGIGNPVNSLTHHLAAERGKLFADDVVTQMVQGDTVPATMFLDERNDGVAGAGVGIGKRGQRRGLLGVSSELEGYGALHIGQITLTGSKSQHRLLTSPRLKGGVSRRH